MLAAGSTTQEKETARAPSSTDSEAEAQMTDLLRKANGILSKLNPQNFAVVRKELRDLDIKTEEQLSGVADLIHEKAIEEGDPCVIYVKLCCLLSTMQVPSKDDPSKKVSFKKFLLTKCQREFEKDNHEEFELMKEKIAREPDKEVQEKRSLLLEQMVKDCKRQSIGNCRLIGELFKVKMLNEGVMHTCVKKLISQCFYENNLECMCVLLTIIGKDFETPKNKEIIDKYFEEIKKFVADTEKISPGISSMMQDVIDLRKSNWVPRADSNPDSAADSK